MLPPTATPAIEAASAIPAVVSTEGVRVPAVVGLALDAAFRTLEGSAVRPGRITEMRASATGGTVTNQFPAPGAEVTQGTPVDPVVATSESSVPWRLVAFVLLGALGAAGASSMVRSKAKVTQQPPAPSLSLAPSADPGEQTASAGGDRMIESEFRFEGRLDAGVQTLNLGHSHRLVTLCVEKRGTS